jgi:hypothetical protein
VQRARYIVSGYKGQKEALLKGVWVRVSHFNKTKTTLAAFWFGQQMYGLEGMFLAQ